jgi:Kef-type K+ transport system membrane component KefB
MFTFLIPMGLGIWSSMSMLNYGFLTSVLLASMYASHTLIAYPIISRYGLSRQRTVSITIGGTAVTVVLALMVLAVIGGMYKGEDVGGLFWVLLVAKVVLLFGLIIFLMPRISRQSGKSAGQLYELRTSWIYLQGNVRCEPGTGG